VEGSQPQSPGVAPLEGALTRTVRLLLLVLGLGIVALLVWHAGPRLVLSMVGRIGWNFLAITGIYALHLTIRATALRRTILRVPVGYADAVRIRLAGEALSKLTLTGPFLAEPAKGWLLKQRGVPGADAFAALAAEYLLYTFVSSWLATLAVSFLLARGALPPAVQTGAVVVLAVTIAFMAAFAFAAIAGIGLIVPILRASRMLIGKRRAEYAAREFAPVEVVLVAFLHAQPGRLAEVLALETAAHLLLISEIWVVIPALGLGLSWTDALILEGGAKIIVIAFAVIPGQVGASEGVYALLAGAIGLPTAAGLTLALVRRMRGLLIAAASVVVLSSFDNHSESEEVKTRA
jgi:hypothetical protein